MQSLRDFFKPDLNEIVDALVDTPFASYMDFSDFLETCKKYKKKIPLGIQLEEFIRRLESGGKNFSIDVFGERELDVTINLPFFFNICWFYRWLLSEGHGCINNDRLIEKVGVFLQSIRVPYYVTEKIKWAVIFCSFTQLGKRRGANLSMAIIDEYSLQSKRNTFSDIIDSWMVHHVLLRRVVRTWEENERAKVDTYGEKLLLSYISLVDANPELENIFGIAIEMDMEAVRLFLLNPKGADYNKV